ncbi:hypothetical protein [Lactiplantibacillus argentoratensis]|uniref:Uncharacterized protein n=1 Tax=Lactiplantibacillus argentoratensis TaxID=271881 RepID=A0ABS5UGL2_9LACO|nr:hypothetical protein [Lactiplantibacillus argentoratensis]MBT1137719.1 hypothetical protein [Lactiplantibacillus argentoratensis]MBT1140576.1 hypothetical protein [Lactiplantibacillus argentoratensis]
MSKYQDSILTTAGLQLASKAYAGKTTFKLTRTATTADVVAADEVKTLMVLPHEAQAGTITQGDSVVSDDHTLITTELLFTNKDLKTGYSINAIGVYALEAGSDKEILYSVAIAEQAEYMPDFADKVLMEFKATITMAVGQISNVTIEMVANNLATQQYVQNAIKDLAKDSEVVHDNHDGTVVINGKTYVPADDSKTVHDNHNGTINANGVDFYPAAAYSSSQLVIPATGSSRQVYNLANFQQAPITALDGGPFKVATSGSMSAFVAPLYSAFPDTIRYVTLDSTVTDFPGGEVATGWITIHKGNKHFDVDVTGVNSRTRYEASFDNGILMSPWRISKFSKGVISSTISCTTCTTGTAKNFIEYEMRGNEVFINMEVWPVGYAGNSSILVSYLGGQFSNVLAGLNGRAMAYNQLGANSNTYAAIQAPITVDNGILRIATSGYTFSNGTTSNINGAFQYQGPIGSLDFTTGFSAYH